MTERRQPDQDAPTVRPAVRQLVERAGVEVRPAPWLASAVVSPAPWLAAAEAQRQAASGADAEAGPGTEAAPDPTEAESTLESSEAESPEEAGPCELCEETRQEASAALAALRQELEQPMRAAVHNLNAAVDDMAQRLVDDTVRLARMMAEAIIRREASLDDSVIMDALVRALDVTGSAPELTLRCHPDDVALLRDNGPLLAETRAGRPVHVVVQPSADVDRGGFFVLSDQGIVDARVSKQIDYVATQVTNAILDHFAAVDQAQPPAEAPEAAEAPPPDVPAAGSEEPS